MKLKNEKFFAVVFFTFAAVLSFGAGELALRAVSSHILIYNIEMLKYANELKMRDPLNEISHVHRPDSSARLMGVDVALNSLGHRSRELKETKPAGEKRVYIAGGSVTMGWGVPAQQVFSRLTEEKLNQSGTAHYEFINAGVGNYGTFSETRLFYRQFEKVKPDMVILHYFINDVEPRTAGNDNSLLQKTYLGAYFYNDIRALVFRNNYENLFAYYKKLYENESPSWKNTRDAIMQLRDFLAEKKIPLVIMIIPDFHNLSKESPYQELYPKMQSAFEEMEIPVLNTFGEFQKLYGSSEEQLWIQTSDPHPNAAGHRVMADMLYDYFVKEKPLGL